MYNIFTPTVGSSQTELLKLTHSAFYPSNIEFCMCVSMSFGLGILYTKLKIAISERKNYFIETTNL